ncbi:MAG: carboxypeptidase-like regulatory domain-containing protein, partial [Bacteroidia bacterium]|nr:carboxypeptidase-like regulatory domain-containing protein [Bacteroidia bacterium]
MKASAYYIILVLFTFASNLHGQQHNLTGKVTNTYGEPLAFVSVQVKGIGPSETKTDISGNYLMKLVNGQYEIVYTLSGYTVQTISVVVKNGDVVQDMILNDDINLLSSAGISARRKDRSEEIIRNAINSKEKNNYSGGYKSEAYIKATEETEFKKSKKKNSKPDTLPPSTSLNLAEINITRYVDYPGKIKEIRNGVTKRGDIDGLFYLSTTQGDFNFYRNLISVPALSESPFLSPVSNSGLIAYKFKMLEIDVIDGKTVYRIKVTPGKLGNALFTGEIEIEDSSWQIRKLTLSFPKFHLVEYDEFILTQENKKVNDSVWMTSTMEFLYKAKTGKAKYSGRTIVYFTDYELDYKFPKRFFNNELSATTLEAYKRDSAYWVSLRKEPLTIKELKYIR